MRLQNDLWERPEGRGKLFDLSHVVLLVTILIALAFIIWLSNDNIKHRVAQARLRSELATSTGMLSGSPEAQVGDLVPSFEGINSHGKRTKVTYDNQTRYLLFVMSLDCAACMSQIPIWNAIVEKIENKECTVFGMTTLPRSVSVPPVNFDLLSIPDMAVQRAYRVVTVPLVMLVSKNGRVEWVHYGTLTNELSSDLLSAIESNPEETRR